MKVLLSILLLMGLVACSGAKKTSDAKGESAEVAEGDEFAEDFAEDFSEDEEELAEGEEADELKDEESSEDEIAEETTPEEPAAVEEEKEEVIADTGARTQEAEMKQMKAAPVQIDTTSKFDYYTVKRGDTLMIVAFKTYGDYEKWPSIARLNAGILNRGTNISEGMRLKYQVPAKKFVWNPEGNPYLIKMGDTLGSISKDTYGTRGYWRNIWNNNRPLIKNPNKIFAGFTLYTPIIEGREVANQEL